MAGRSQSAGLSVQTRAVVVADSRLPCRHVRTWSVAVCGATSGLTSIREAFRSRCASREDRR